MKIAVIGDTHLGRTLYGYDTTPSTKEIMYGFLGFCMRNDVDLAVHLGDLFDNPEPTVALEKLALQWCNEFERRHIDLYLMVGNHDVNPKGGSALDVIKAALYKCVRVLDDPMRTFRDAGGKKKGADIMFAPFPSHSRYPGSEKWVEALMSLQGGSDGSVLFAHANVNGASIDNQEFIYRGSDYVLPDKLVFGGKSTLTVCGHIHKHQAFRKGPSKCCILGAAQRLRFSESRNKCEFLLINVDGSSITMEVEPVEGALKLVDWEVDATYGGNQNIAVSTDELLELVPNVNQKLVKVRATADETTVVDWDAMREALYARGALYVVMPNPTWVPTRAKLIKKYTAEDPNRIARFFIKKRINNPEERDELMKLFKGMEP